MGQLVVEVLEATATVLELAVRLVFVILAHDRVLNLLKFTPKKGSINIQSYILFVYFSIKIIF